MRNLTVNKKIFDILQRNVIPLRHRTQKCYPFTPSNTKMLSLYAIEHKNVIPLRHRTQLCKSKQREFWQQGCQLCNSMQREFWQQGCQLCKSSITLRVPHQFLFFFLFTGYFDWISANKWYQTVSCRTVSPVFYFILMLNLWFKDNSSMITRLWTESGKWTHEWIQDEDILLLYGTFRKYNKLMYEITIRKNKLVYEITIRKTNSCMK